MNKNKKQKTKHAITASILAFGVGMFFLWWKDVKAVNEVPSITTGLSQENAQAQDETAQKLKALDDRARIYKDIIDIKKKQGETLNNQLSIADSNIAQIQAQMDVSKQQIDDFNSQITRIENQIHEKSALIESQKKILTNLIQSYYEINLANPLISYLADDNIASFIVKKDRVAQTSDRINGLVESVKKIKDDLEAQTIELNRKKGDVVAIHSTLKDQGSDLESMKSHKETLLAQTKGEEARYTQLLARVEQQKQELLDIDQYFAASGLSVDSYPKPDSKYFASTDWFFSQRDPRWGNETIGNTKTLMKSYGCAVTAIAMVLKQHGGTETPGTLTKKPIYSGDLINWPGSWDSPRISLVSSLSHGSTSVDWSIIDSQVAKGHPVIVYIGKSNGGGGHYVVIHHKEASTGKYVVHDPYFGPNIYLDTTRALVGAMGANGSTKIDQMIIYN